MSFHKILCPVDFSEATAGAARYAAQWARRYNASLTLLHVAPAADFGYSLLTPEAGSMVEFTQHRNETVRRALSLFPGEPALDYPAERAVAVGHPAEEIVRLAKKDGYDLIVMPTHGAGAIRRWLLVGSVTTKVLHTAECPVLAATDFNGRTASRGIGHMVCALDLTERCQPVLCTAAGLAREAGVPLTAVHAVPGLGEAAADFFDESWRTTLKSRATESMKKLLEEARVEGRIAVEAGTPEKVVCEVAASTGAGLVVAGRGASNGVFGRLRAHTYEIIRHAPCPVLSV